jgi:hypothetical protein
MDDFDFVWCVHFASPLSIPGESSVVNVWEGAVGTLLVGLITAQSVRWIFTGRDYFQSED